MRCSVEMCTSAHIKWYVHFYAMSGDYELRAGCSQTELPWTVRTMRTDFSDTCNDGTLTEPEY